MSLESEIVSLTAAVKELTEALVASRATVTTTHAVGDVSITRTEPVPERVTMTYTPEVAKRAAEVVEALANPKTEAPKPEPAPEAPKAEASSAGLTGSSGIEGTTGAPVVTTYDLLDIARAKMAKAGGRDKVVAALKNLGLTRVSECPEDKRVALKKALEVLP